MSCVRALLASKGDWYANAHMPHWSLRGSSLRIRLQRFGERHSPFYRIVAAPRRTKRDGKHHEILGTYNPIPDSHGNKQVSLKVDRIKYWMTAGAEPSERVIKLLGLSGVLPPAPRRWLAPEPLPESQNADCE